MKIKINYILALVVAVLAVMCWQSVYKPVHFDDVRARREKAVKARLRLIRTAEETFKERYGTYAASFDELSRARLLPDSLRRIPFARGKSFEITVSQHTGKSGSTVPLMEIGARYDDYLLGLDEHRIKELNDEADRRGLFPGLKIGDITTPNDNAGNWE